MTSFKSVAACVGLLASVAACGPDRQPGPEQTPAVAMQQLSPTMPGAQLPPEVLAQLKEQYPVLRETPAPEPQPHGDAVPDEVPERLRKALPERVLQAVTGNATFYADKFEGRRTASGIPFRQNQMVAAHRAFPFGTLLRVTNLHNERAVNVRVVDRGPFASPKKAAKPIIDLSRRAAEQLGYVDAGRA